MDNQSQSNLKYTHSNIFDDLEMIKFYTIASSVLFAIVIYFLGKSDFETWYSVGGFFLLIYWTVNYLKYQDFKRSASHLWQLITSKEESPTSAHHLVYSKYGTSGSYGGRGGSGSTVTRQNYVSVKFSSGDYIFSCATKEDVYRVLSELQNHYSNISIGTREDVITHNFQSF